MTGRGCFSKFPCTSTVQSGLRNTVVGLSVLPAKASPGWTLIPVLPSAPGCGCSCVLSQHQQFSSFYWMIPISMTQTCCYFSHLPPPPTHTQHPQYTHTHTTPFPCLITLISRFCLIYLLLFIGKYFKKIVCSNFHFLSYCNKFLHHLSREAGFIQ